MVSSAKARRRAARRRYKPDHIRCLLIAEAPPSEDRYFYFEDVPTRDNLFVAAMDILFPDDFRGYVGARSRKQKSQLLRLFRDRGYWLIDSVDEPVPNGLRATARYLLQRSDLLQRLRRLESRGAIKRTTPIVLIKATVYDAFFNLLRNHGYCVINRQKIPFPSTRQQGNFRRAFSRILELIP